MHFSKQFAQTLSSKAKDEQYILIYCNIDLMNFIYPWRGEIHMSQQQQQQRTINNIHKIQITPNKQTSHLKHKVQQIMGTSD